MKRVIGIGGIFFKANDPEKLAAWYKKHLGLDVQDWGGVSFQEGAGADLRPKRQSHIVWSPFEANTDYFKPSEKQFMINYRVHVSTRYWRNCALKAWTSTQKQKSLSSATSAGSWTQKATASSYGNRQR